MTKINIKNNKKKTTTIVATALVFAVIMLSPSTIIPNVNAVTQSALIDQINANLDANPVSVPSISEEQQLEKIVFSNSEVQKIINGKPHSIMAIGFTGFAIYNPIKWNPVVSINVANTTEVSVTVDSTSNLVKKVESEPLVKLTCCSTGPGYSTDEYKSSTNPIGLYATATAVSYNVNVGSMDGPVFQLLNGQEFNPSGNACSSSNVLNGYWAQVGFWYKPVGSPAAVGTVADTASSCNDVGTGVTYNPSDTYIFKIIPQSNPITWKTTITDVQNSGNTYTLPRTGMHYANMQGNIANTSMWIESWNSQSVNSWSGRFGSSPSANAYYYDGTSFLNWPSDRQHDDTCTTINVYPWAHQVMGSTSLANGGTGTWNMSTMANYAYGC